MLKSLAIAILTLFSIILTAQPIFVASAQAATTCPDAYLPVCGTVDGTQKPFRNECFARAAGATHLVKGACTNPIRFCPMIYQPVCAIKFGVRRTYSNSCEANRAGATDISTGQCLVRPTM